MQAGGKADNPGHPAVVDSGNPMVDGSPPVFDGGDPAIANGGVVVVTTDGIPGCRISAIIGAVVGVTSRSFSAFQEGIKSVDDGRSMTTPERTELLRRGREEAIELLAWQARRLGANAVVAMRFDHRQVTDHWNEICAYGTAIRITMAQPAAAPASATVYQGGTAQWGNSAS
jgi:uncharacterized protein YbjQ (UPF0145 family)